jgi:hypothetical protein
VTDAREVSERFDCFGSSCEAFVSGDGPGRSAREAVELVQRRLHGWHEGFSRFLPDSELSRLNADPRWEVPVSLLMARLAQTVRVAATLTGGLVDATLVEQIEAAGYAADLGEPVPLSQALVLAPPRRPAGAGSAASCWRRSSPTTTPSPSTAPATCRSAERGQSRVRSTCRARSTAERCTASSYAVAAWRRAASGAAAGLTSTVVLRIICSTRTPAGRRSPGSCR